MGGKARADASKVAKVQAATDKARRKQAEMKRRAAMHNAALKVDADKVEASKQTGKLSTEQRKAVADKARKTAKQYNSAFTEQHGAFMAQSKEYARKNKGLANKAAFEKSQAKFELDKMRQMPAGGATGRKPAASKPADRKAARSRRPLRAADIRLVPRLARSPETQTPGSVQAHSVQAHARLAQRSQRARRRIRSESEGAGACGCPRPMVHCVCGYALQCKNGFGHTCHRITLDLLVSFSWSSTSHVLV